MRRKCASGAVLLLGASLAQARQLGLQAPESPIAQQIYDLHGLIFGICVVVFIAVFSVMFYSIFKHRKSLGAKPATFHENTTVEVIWTIVPFVILVSMAIPATSTVLAMKDTSEAEMTIKVTGYQWKWGYDYLKGEGEGISFYSNLTTPYAQIHNQAPKGEDYLLEVDNPLVVPVGKKIRVLTTANDVIHSFWVGALGFKQDAIPGFVRDTWFLAKNPGVYRGQCVELCGKDHGFMPIVIHAMEQDAYKTVGGRQETAARGVPHRPEQDVYAGRAQGTGREGVSEQLRGLSSGQRHGCAGCLPGALGLESDDRPGRRSDQARAERQAGHGHGLLQAALGHRDRGGRDL